MEYSKSFAYHIEVELGEKLEDVWDFEKNTVNPYHISKCSGKKVWIKCENADYHGSYEIRCSKYFNNRRCPYCNKNSGKVHPKDSFVQYHIDNTDKDFLNKYWDYELNTVNPFDISPSSNIKIWLKCNEKDYHGSYETKCYEFTGFRNKCRYCLKKGINRKTHPKDSFARYCIDNIDKNFLEKYWDYEKNTIDPFRVATCTNLKVWIKCQEKDYHGSYEVKCAEFIKGKRCGYCHPSGKIPKVHLYDSFGYNNLDKVLINWHSDNKLSPFGVAINSNNKYKFICEKCGTIWSASLANINKGRWCPTCKSSKGEKRVKEWLDKHNLNYVHDSEYFNDLLSKKGNRLRPDFILEDLKVWIEYDGEFHYNDFYKDGSYETIKTHDEIKNTYAKIHNYKMIRIPYFESDNIENILEKTILL